MKTIGRALSAAAWILTAVVLILAALLPFAIAGREVVATAGTWTNELPEEVLSPMVPQRSVILDKDGNRMADVYLYNRIVVPLDRISKHAVNAAVAVEDRRFYEHNGVDLESTGRAILANLRAGSVSQGGSGITQQYVKNLLGLAGLNGNPEEAWVEASAKTLDRKWKEARYALALEKRASKQDIIAGYLNTSYFGNGAYGIQAASKYYFDTDASDLLPSEAALLVGMLQAPSYYDPFTQPEAAVLRRNVVLNAMRRNGSISFTEYQEAVGSDLGADPHDLPGRCANSSAPFYCAYVEEELLRSPLLGSTEEQRRKALAEGGLIIRTGLDQEVQEAVDSGLSRLPQEAQLAAAAAVVEPGSGVISALGTSREWGKSARRGQTQILLPTVEAFQVGSVFKAFTLATALNAGIDPATILPAGQTHTSRVFENPEKGYFSNYDSTPWKNLSLRDATKWSVNTAYVQLQEMAGTLNVARTAKALGVSNLETEGENAIRETEGSLTLGARETSVLNIASAYSSLAARGLACEQHAILSVVRRDGKEIEGSSPYPPCRQVISPAAAANTTDILQSVLLEGTGTAARLKGRPAAGKTGTTNGEAAIWFAGFTPQVAAAVWVGDPRGPQFSTQGQYTPDGTSSAILPQVIWKDIVESILAGQPVIPFEEPTRLSVLDWGGGEARQRAGIPIP